MLFDSINLVSGSEIQSAIIGSGTSFPILPKLGQLFYITGGVPDIGLYNYNGSDWIRVLIDGDSSDLPNIITPGTYKSVTVNSQGLVTAGTNPTTLAGYGITNAQPLDADLTAIAALSGTSGLARKTAANTWALDTANYLTNNQTITISGDASATGTTALNLTLASSGVTAGAYGSASSVATFSVDAKGRLTAASSTPIVIAESQITDAGILVRNAGNETITGSWNFNSPVVGVTPTLDSHLATKSYVDNIASMISPQQSVKATTTANITLSGTQTIDGVTLIVGDRVLVKNQTNAAQNGIYAVAAGAWTRTSDFDGSPVNEVKTGSLVFVESGTLNSNSSWVLITQGTIIVGTTLLDFAVFSRAGDYLGGAGLTKTGNTFNVGTASTSRIVVNADNIDLATTAVSPGTYGTITVDQYGRATSGGAQTWADVTGKPTTISGFGITDAQPLSPLLSSIASLTPAVNEGIFTSGSGSNFATYPLTIGGRALAGVLGTANTFPYFSGTNIAGNTAINAEGRGILANATTVGESFATTANPSAIRFPRVNADNTVSYLSDDDFRVAIGAGTGAGGGTVTSVDMTVPTGLTISGNPITSSGTLALALQSGYSIPTTANQTNWSTAFTQTRQWNGGSTGLVPATGRTSLELGTVATSDLTTSLTDTTLGRVVKVGDFGIGEAIVSTETDANNYNVPGSYLSPTTGKTNFPAGVGAERVLISVSGRSGGIKQEVVERGTNRYFSRTTAGDGVLVGVPWVENWNSASLEKVSSSTDTTIGRVLTVGWMGLGVESVGVTDFNGISGNRFIGGSSDTTANRPAGFGWTTGLNLSRVNTDTETAQIVFNTPTGALAYRTRYSVTPGVYNAWRFPYDTGNTSADVQSILAAADFDEIRSTLELNDASSLTAGILQTGRLSGVYTITVNGNATTATTATSLATGRTIGMTGDVTWTSGPFTGNSNVTGTATLANSGVPSGTYNNSATQVRPFTVDPKGRITAVPAAVTITPAWSSVTSKPASVVSLGLLSPTVIGTTYHVPLFVAGDGVLGTQIVTEGGRALWNVSGTANTMPYFSGTNVADTTGLTAAGRALLDDNSANDQLITLGGTIVGRSFFTTANPSAITFPRVNANNTVTYLNAADYRAATSSSSKTLNYSITGTAYNVDAGDDNNYGRCTNAAAKTITFRPNATHALPTDSVFYFRNVGAGDLTFIEGSGVIINPPQGGTLVVAQHGTVCIRKVGTNEFDLMGQVVPV